MRLLIVGDINSEIKKAIDLAQARKVQVMMVGNVEAALDFVREGKGADLVLIDSKYDLGLLIKSMHQEHISTPVIAYGVDCSPKVAVAAIKAGAKEFLPLPPDEKLIAAIFTAISDNTRPLIGASAAIQEVIAIADKIAPTDANILITGKSGTGKEVFAHYIHEHSTRAQKSFIRVNCAAIPENLLESELFGHEKGAFTGAIARRIGKFEESSGGTLLLDEISEMDIKLQAKLLRAIQEQEIDRVGGTGPIKVDLRIIATSNRNLPEEIANGTFREDLYFRLNIINIELPKLSERKEDIIVLSNNFVNKYANNNKLAVKPLSKSAIDKMINYSWPGNVRELENVIHRAVLLSNGEEIQAEDIYLKSESFVGKKIVDVEKELIVNTVGYCLGDLTNAANILGISISTLKEKLELYTKSLS
ncbi:sigma-54-dependent transcriptional regulator [Candidatus Trichorickettsia mobilis]|uniref:sigma-54-dependent transcriptional regulator n=1 Tax=Candidatus Trichorickettsia mobilis TaxID=1346319 RepID=UPI002930E88E|nr:sigma-54 dependent transcriptional regulator [Candidatus Trichorickettsia mobilis]